MESNLHNFLVWLSLPIVGLPAVFTVSFVSATLLPMGSEPVLFGYLRLNPDMFWVAILVATVGNTLGGMLDWLMGFGASKAHEKLLGPKEHKLLKWFEKLGPQALLLSWLPIVGDPLCAVAGWLRLPWVPCLIYMAIGKFLRYLTMTYALLMVPDGFWSAIGQWLGLI
ncbi:YqaA family protein [Polynucleobacter victoriensis]|uniref:Membrane protein YqaA, SNARE-associated domain n=1 Tax=Polynucleobacter victoriensis TaxID=2049319 RepID=A0A212TF10_9BURK|nr:YqaA family protein [Polynucleobacter victoriensis]SNC64421.1 membrane protein YqaA, SNARE-associated domain [Polynucleobacter victoriensis]